MVRKLTQIKINGTDVSSKVLNYTITPAYNEIISDVTMTFKNSLINSVSTLKTGMTLEIWEGFTTSTDLKRFSGYISRIEKDGLRYKIRGLDKLWLAVRKNVTAKFDKDLDSEAGVISEIFKTLINTYAGLTANDTSVQASGSVFTLETFNCKGTDVYERCQQLSRALDWQMYYRADTDLVYFEPKGFTLNPNVINIGGASNNVVGRPKWKEDLSNVVNIIKAKGAYVSVSVTDTFSGDGSETTFTLSQIPQSVKVVVDGTEQTGGAVGSTATFDYSIEASSKLLIFESGSIPSNDTNNIVVEILYKVPLPVLLDNETSRTLYGDFEKEITLTDVQNVADAEQRVITLLDKWAFPPKSTKITVKASTLDDLSLRIGDRIRIIDSKNSVDDFFFLTNMTIRYPNDKIEIKVKDRDPTIGTTETDTKERIKRLEEELYNEDELLLHIKKFENKTKHKRVSIQRIKQNLNDSFDADQDTNSVCYDDDETSIIDDFEDKNDWSQGSGSVSLTLTDNSTSGHFWVGTQGVKAAWSVSSGTGIIQNTQAQGNLSPITGQNSGTPSQGTAGVWVYATDASDITEIRLRIGSSATDYKEYIGQTYQQKVGPDSSFALEDGVRYYILFDLDSPDATSGTADWTAVDFVQFRFTVAGAGDMTFDYHTASKDNTIALNGAGDRTTTYSTATTTY